MIQAVSAIRRIFGNAVSLRERWEGEDIGWRLMHRRGSNLDA
jgi:hypothetical protein